MDQEITFRPIAFVRNDRTDKSDDHWGKVTSQIELVESLPASCFDGIEAFSHLEILFYLHKATETVIGSEHPRENKVWPKVGIFAQRKKDRPNHLGLTTVNLIRREGKTLIVTHLDADAGTPVLDIKPVFREFLPKGTIRQAPWSVALMKKYWNS